MWRSLGRRFRSRGIRCRRCSSSARRPSFFYSSGFTTRGTRSPISHSSGCKRQINGIRAKVVRDLRRELLLMVAEDLRTREELAENGSLYGAYHPRMQQVHQRNAARLREILDEHGWPGLSLVG